MPQFLDAVILVHIAGLLQVAGYLSKNQLVLRHLLLAGTVFYLAYYVLSGPAPQWHAVFWSCFFLIANLYVIVLLYSDRRRGSMTSDEQRLAEALATLTPGQFRRLMRAASWRTAAGPTILTIEGEVPPALYFVLDGEVEITKAERSFPVAPGLFIGEVAWLLKCPATATVELGDGARYVVWDAMALRKLLSHHHDLRIAFEGLLNRDLARKIGKS